MGQEKWDELRLEIYAKYDYHCAACGVHKSQARGHQWLEAHEYYSIDYHAGRVEIESIEPLCHYCHNFIHSGRLKMIMGKEKTREEVVEILEHGFMVLSENRLQVFPHTLQLARSVDAETFNVQPYYVPPPMDEWSDWRLVWEGNEYAPLFDSSEEWAMYWDR